MDWWVAPSLAAGSKDVPRVALAVLRKCDCLNACGDDPGLRDRIAEPCPRRQKEAADIAAAIAQQERITQLLAQTGHATTGVLAALEQLAALLAAQPK